MTEYTPNDPAHEIPYGYCHCGCGRKTNLSQDSRNAPIGTPCRFLPGHYLRPFLPRFWKKVAVRGRDDCWEWQGVRFSNGYGCIVIKNHQRAMTHRVAYELAYGPIPEGMHILHSCDNPPCCNPAHLRTGTAQENYQDARLRGRTNPPRGTRSGKAKLTEANVKEIRDIYSLGGIAMREIARQYGVSYSTIHGIICRSHWKHIP